MKMNIDVVIEKDGINIGYHAEVIQDGDIFVGHDETIKDSILLAVENWLENSEEEVTV